MRRNCSGTNAPPILCNSISSRTDEGLVFSLLVYVAAVLSALDLFVVPVVCANGSTVMENAGVDYARELLAARRDLILCSSTNVASSKRIYPGNLSRLKISMSF
jgi:hypothetical protein